MWTRDSKLIFGVVHLLPLPGSSGYGGCRKAIRSHALRDAESYLEGGCHGLVVENFGDAPFRKAAVEAPVVAEMTRLASEIVALAADRPVGVNVLRNDALSALSIAAASGARFIRVNVHTGSMFTDQGLIEGRADETLRWRRILEAEIEIMADVGVKHALPPAGFDLEAAARDTAGRGGADALIVTGGATGDGTAIAEIERVKQAAGSKPVLAGSGVRLENLQETLRFADGAIVGTSLKEDGELSRPVDKARVRALVDVARAC